MTTIYLSRPRKELLRRDPVLDRLGENEVHVLEVEGHEDESRIVSQVAGLVEQTPNSRKPITVILDAFLGTPPGRFDPGIRWNADASEVDRVLDRSEDIWSSKTDGLMSLRLVWKLWARFGSLARILVTTNGVEVSPYVRLALADAYGEGKVCLLYNWSVTSVECDRLTGSLEPAAAIGGA